MMYCCDDTIVSSMGNGFIEISKTESKFLLFFSDGGFSSAESNTNIMLKIQPSDFYM